MKRWTAMFLFILGAGNSFCQSSLTLPAYKNSVGLEFIYPAEYFLEVFDPETQVVLPSFNLSTEVRINKKFYGEFGFIPFADGGEIRKWNLENYKNRIYYALYAGGVMKFRIINRLYFTPSLDLLFYQDKYKKEYNDLYLGFSGSIGFEYFLSNRISVNTDLLSMGYGLKFHTYPTNLWMGSNHFSYFQEHGYASVSKLLSIGVHYNFGRKK